MAVWYIEDQIRNFPLKKTLFISTVQNGHGKNDIACVISRFRGY